MGQGAPAHPARPGTAQGQSTRGSDGRKDRAWAGGPPLGLPVGPNQERVLGLSSQTPFQCLCQAGRAKGQPWFGFIKKLCYIKN